MSGIYYINWFHYQFECLHVLHSYNDKENRILEHEIAQITFLIADIYWANVFLLYKQIFRGVDFDWFIRYRVLNVGVLSL